MRKFDTEIPLACSGNDPLDTSCKDHLCLWQNTLKHWMPENLFDAHIHLGLREFMHEDFSSERLKIAISSFGHMTIEELDEIYAKAYEGKNIVGLFAFPFPQFEIDSIAANCYIIELMKKTLRVKGFFLSDPSDFKHNLKIFSMAETAGVRFTGVKPYFDRLGKKNADTLMHEILSDRLLSFINSEKLLLMLHTTGRGVADKNVVNSLLHIIEKYPDIKIILAHMGRYLTAHDFESFMNSGLPDSENIYFDISFASEKSVYDLALSHRGVRKRLLFASDNPFGLITGGEFFTETGDALLLTRDKYTWSESGTYGYDMTLNTYHCMKALKDSIEEIEEDSAERDAIKNDIFLNNALCLMENR